MQLFPATMQNDPRIALRFIRATTLSGSSMQLSPATIQLSRLSMALFPAYLKLADNPLGIRRERPLPQVIPQRLPGHTDPTIESTVRRRAPAWRPAREAGMNRVCYRPKHTT
jgi:hypothetical protein